MAKTHNLGYPRIGAQRELKRGMEAYWSGNRSREELLALGAAIRQENWNLQSGLDYVPVGEFSLYDHVLDMSFTLGNVPQRVPDRGDPLDNYFRVARGRSTKVSDDADSCPDGIAASEMTKWFDTNYHYIVPELSAGTQFQANPQRLVDQIREAKKLSHAADVKPVLVGPVTYLWLGKSKDDSSKLESLPALVETYQGLLESLRAEGVDWVQMDEPILATDLDNPWASALDWCYTSLRESDVNLLLTTYFGPLLENLSLLAELPVAGFHVEAIDHRHEAETLRHSLSEDQVLSLGVVNGRNVWKADLTGLLEWLQPMADQLGDRLWLAPSCSLLHLPLDVELETGLDEEVRSWLSFARQRISELGLLKKGLNEGASSIETELAENRDALQSRIKSTRVRNPSVQAAARADSIRSVRQSQYAERAACQSAALSLPRFPTTTIGSFPQTDAIRKTRRQYKNGEIDEATYRSAMESEIAECIRQQEALGLDVLVHGEAERNDMVEYFGEQLDGFAFSRFGWVQSYGSRCVKPPILYGDVRRKSAMTVEWTTFAQSLTSKPVKGMLTGPVTILNWSFVRDDQPRSESCQQIALAMRDEVQDLEAAGIRIIQIDEAALREGLPLRRLQWQAYLEWTVHCFRITSSSVADETQIHTHMCYSEFNDIIEAIANMDADIITIESSRSEMELLEAFESFEYPNQIGPGVYDIHSPNIPSESEIVEKMRLAAERIPSERLWVNPDCGLKTRRWDEVLPALANMVAAAHALRTEA